MSLHRLTSITIGVPDIEACSRFYTDFGLTNVGDNVFASADGDEQLRLTHTPKRRLANYGIGVDNADDIERMSRRLRSIGISPEDQGPEHLTVTEAVSDVRVEITVAQRIVASPHEPQRANTPTSTGRPTLRADPILRTGPVAPRRLGHCVLGTPDFDATRRFFVDGIGMKISDEVRNVGTFLRCSTDHHNLLVQHAPTTFLHHTSWQVDDVDDIGRGATSLLGKDPKRHVWGLGRHHIGSNYFWYFRDPAGNFAEYYADGDVIVDDELWTPETFDGDLGLYNWGPPPPPSFITPDDLADLMQ